MLELHSSVIFGLKLDYSQSIKLSRNGLLKIHQGQGFVKYECQISLLLALIGIF